MPYTHFFNNNTDKYTTLYLFYIERFSTYKLGVTSNFDKRIDKYIEGQPFVDSFATKEEKQKKHNSKKRYIDFIL